MLNGDPPRRVLIVRMSHLGDIVQTLPLVHCLRERWPDVELGWAIQPEFAPLVEPFAKVFPFDRRGGARAWPRIRRAMRAFRPDVALDAQGNWKSAFCTRLSGAPLRYGFERSAWQEPAALWLAGARVAPGSSQRHLVERSSALGQFVTSHAAAPRLDPLLSAEELAAGSEALVQAIPTGAPVVLHPGVEGDPRTWPKERFLDLGQRLVADGRSTLILTGPAEEDTGRWLERELPEAVHIVGQRGLRELCGLLAAVAGRGGRMVVSDSGPAHVAASVGLGVTLVAGPEDPARTGPWPVPSPSEELHRVASSPWSRRNVGTVAVELGVDV